jgi:hypothetical protein
MDVGKMAKLPKRWNMGSTELLRVTWRQLDKHWHEENHYISHYIMVLYIEVPLAREI